MKRSIIFMMLISLVGIPNSIHAMSMGSMDYTNELTSTLPSVYDGRNYCSLVKDQEIEGSCWAYIANGALETSLMKKYNILDKNFYNFSEEHMDYSTSIDYADDYGFQRKNGDAGYMTFELEKPLVVSGKFLVAIEVTSKNLEHYSIPIEANNEIYCINAETALGRGYVAIDIEGLVAGDKYDIVKQEANLCLKAFTKKLSK